MITKKELSIIIVMIGAFCIANAQLDIMDIDAAQYAQMSFELLSSKNWLKLTCLHQNYLDKPPLLFWLSALSFKIFGIHNWSYKLPSLIFAVLGIFATYRLGDRLVNRSVGIYSAVILGTSFAFFQLTHDIRTDTMLMGSVIFSAWQLYEFYLDNKLRNVIYAGIGIALGMMSKGPIGLIVPFCFFFIFTALYKKKIKLLFNFKLIWILVVVFIMLLPMCIGLYQQFDWHGINFFFWYQSFGRITGENTWKNNPDRFFLFHTTLWAFLPWTLLSIYALIREVKALVTYQSKIAGVSLTFLLTIFTLSFSKYQLPHYIFVAYPFLAIMCANYAEDFFASKMRYLQGLLMVLAIICCVIINFYCFPTQHFLLLLIVMGLAVVSFLSTTKITATAMPISFLLFSLSVGFQSELLKYQSFNEVGRYLKTKKTAQNQIINFNGKFSFAFYFYSQDYTLFYTTIEELLEEKKHTKELLVYTSEYGYGLIKNSSLNAKTTILQRSEGYEVTQLRLTFLDPKQRHDVTTRYYLLKIL